MKNIIKALEAAGLPACEYNLNVVEKECKTNKNNLDLIIDNLHGDNELIPIDIKIGDYISIIPNEYTFLDIKEMQNNQLNPNRLKVEHLSLKNYCAWVEGYNNSIDLAYVDIPVN